MTHTEKTALEAERLLNRISRNIEIQQIIRAGQAIKARQVQNKQRLYAIIREINNVHNSAR